MKSNHSYLHWDTKNIADSLLESKDIDALYDKGYVFTRLGKGMLQQTRSVRINLKKFSPTSENRRILRKVAGLRCVKSPLPLADYHWSLGKLAKDFYDTKFHHGIMSAAKIKAMLTDPKESNFNTLLTFYYKSPDATKGTEAEKEEKKVGYAICYSDETIFHYCYPFYDISLVETHNLPRDIGLGMMLHAIVAAHDEHLSYVYLGSLQRPTDTYKLQFDGLEWYNGDHNNAPKHQWSENIDLVKKILL